SVKLASNTAPSILKLVGEVEMGKAALVSVDSETTVYVPTGGHLPPGANSVVMIENTDQLNDEIIINKSVTMWENVLQKGTDISVGTKVLSKNSLITPLVIGALKSIGIDTIEVYEKLSVSLISTGDEIVKNKQKLRIGEIRDINSYTISNHLKNKNVIINDNVITNDDFELYKNAVIKGFENSDIVISSGGSSVGDKDYTFDILKNMGATLLVHGVNIKPGKPTIIAKYQNKLFFGLPGQPTSAFFVLNTFIDTVINTIYHIDKIMPSPYIEAVLQKNVHSVTGRRMYQLVKVEYNEKKELIAIPLFAKSGMINALKEASGYIVIDEFIEGCPAGETVKVYRLGD
ncbi:MAG: molybdopterin molybdotransferase MoeA, partial [Candidatus Izimaplasma sp.]|nr:molybdopterin molybdotransferase MoeA [Candidatus Izimaplasma bacterium]